jgi:polyisoprenoid-binding protein YceI
LIRRTAPPNSPSATWGISTVRGTFTELSGTLQYDPAGPAKSSLDVTIDAASVDSRVEMRDNDVRGPKLLGVAKYPTITFKSKRVEPAGPGKLKVTGDLTIHGVTKETVWTSRVRPSL